MTVEIPLTGKRGGVALVDDVDAELVSQFRWWPIVAKRGGFYAMRGVHFGPPYLMHRLILSPPRGAIIDHADFNGLNNTRDNLRPCSYAQSNAHVRTTSQHGYRGVRLRGDVWFASCSFEHRRTWRGPFGSVQEAARAYDEMARRFHGEFAILNFPDASNPQEAKPTPAARNMAVGAFSSAGASR